MSERGLFFNALPDDSEVGYDKVYNADDLSDWLGVVWENGVVKGDGLKVTAASGMTVNVGTGRAAIKGKAYINRAIKSFTLSTAPTGTASRYDYIVVRYDNSMSVRDIKAELVTGTNSIPTADKLTRVGSVYELMLAYIEVKPNVTSIAQAQITDTRGNKDLCPWFTAVKGYDEYYDAIVQTHESTKTLSSASNIVETDLPSNLYNSKYSLVEVYTNGLKEPTSAYTVSLSGGHIVITFTAQKSAGAVITAKLDNFIDGEGLSTAIAEYNAFAQAVAEMQTAHEYNYICNGKTDNVEIGNLVRAYLQGGTDYGSTKLNIIGNIGMTAPSKGAGTTSSPYVWFDFNVESNRNIVIDFTRCGQISPTITNGSYNYIFATNNAHIIGATVIASNTTTETVIRISETASGAVKFENCRFYVTCYKYGIIAVRGTFTNCRGSVANVVENSYCFQPTTYGVIRVIGGEYYAYTGDASRQSAIVGQSGADAVSILYGVSAPTLARGGFYQTNSLLQWVDGGILSCTDLITLLPMVVVSGISNIRGTIARSKTNVW